MKKRPRGRPPKDPDDVLSARLEVRMTESELTAIEQAAAHLDLSVAEWTRTRLYAAVQRQKRRESEKQR